MLQFIFRLLLLLIAISALRRIVKTLLRFFSVNPAVGRPIPDAASSHRSAGYHGGKPAQATVLQKDPVCGTYVAGDTSLKRIVQGKVLHFCSEECRDRYVTVR